ncbi:hypothetical protein EsVE80_07370 [Enterococcus saigonensis]|uniref:Xylose isomerase-like TIM barrel domain-containing protein n=1 Tax=Enterococcus saigonensis TaxID=1805431 RepID=A0A679IN53_9ENTE|nr:sugar phosphate isomerase/epimerase [Enterococcus saigonensis]BCA85214.1 hypothetical protein EsVE80_07370 [Enterococcus saigonensis]
MEKNKIVLNFLAFAKKIENGAQQNELFAQIAALGFQAVEIRREYFKDITKEIPLIKKEAERLQLELFYSVPDEVYINGEVNPKLKRYIDEANSMGVKQIKWNIGDFTGELHLKEMKALVDKGVAITIENDQTQTSGTIAAIKKYMTAVKATDLGIGYVYDLGNWRFVGQDEVKAAEELAEYVHYIHVKDVRYENDQPQATGLDHGVIDWRKVLGILPANLPIAIEYPTTTDEEILEAKLLLEEEVK